MINTIYIDAKPHLLSGINLHINDEWLLKTIGHKICCIGYLETPLFIKYHGKYITKEMIENAAENWHYL